ncbi:MAG: thiopurine S-methyltransferase [Balneolaceae bacterium]
MEISFWENKWRQGQIGFHMEDGYEPLKKYWDKLDLPKQSTVFVPFCGKSVDLVWLAGNGASVLGIEVIEQAVQEFFHEQHIAPNIQKSGDFTIYKSGPIQIIHGNFFHITKSSFPDIDVIYDKGGLVAVPEEKQTEYVDHLLNLANPHTKILLHHFEYPQNEMSGPPFSVPLSRIKELFGDGYSIRTLLQETTNKKYEKFAERGLQSALLERFLFLESK